MLFVLRACTKIHRLCGMNACWPHTCTASCHAEAKRSKQRPHTCTATWHTCQVVTPCTRKPQTCVANLLPLGTQQRPGLHAGPQEPQPAPQDSDRHQDATVLPASIIPEQAAPDADSPRPPADDAAPPPHDHDLTTAGRQHETQQQHVAVAHQAGQALPGNSIRKTDDKGGGLKGQQLQMLREHVARVTETAACLPALDGNGAECEKVRAPAGMAIHHLTARASPLCVTTGKN